MRKLLALFACAAMCVPAMALFHYRGHHHYQTKDYGVKRSKGLKKKSFTTRKHSFRAFRGPIPNALDLRPQLSPIEDQGQCGSCWAFSLTATHRDGYKLLGRDPGRLSQEWLVEHSKEAAGCSGGYFDSAEELLTGQPGWDSCPYDAGNGSCPENLPRAAHIAGWHMLGENGQSPTPRDIEAYMATAGKPVSTTVAAAAGAWESYASGVYGGCAFGGTDHMINIVGWDNEGASFDAKGNLPPGKGVWILRNSWSTEWGENGYMRTKMTDERGRRCNNVAEEAAYFDFDDETNPIPVPTPQPPPKKDPYWWCAIAAWLPGC